METAHAERIGIGAVGSYFLGIWVLNEPSQVTRYLCVLLIIAGIMRLKFSGGG